MLRAETTGTRTAGDTVLLELTLVRWAISKEADTKMSGLTNNPKSQQLRTMGLSFLLMEKSGVGVYQGSSD